MGNLRTMWKKDPGFVVSGGAHVLALVFLLVEFAHPVTVSDPTDSVSVEMVTTSQLDQIMQGEKTAKLMEKPQRRVDKVADVEDHKPAPPLAEAKRDTPPPPAPEKANDDPGEDTKPPQPVAALPPPRPPEPAPVTPPAPLPPERPIEKADTPPPPPKPEASKEPPPPPDAEALAPKPPPRPKLEPKKVAKTEPVLEAKPIPRPPVKEAKQEPEPPKRPEPPKKDVPKKDAKQTLDQVAKLLDAMKPPKPVVKTRAGNETKDAQSHSDFSPDKISALLDHEAPQRKASTGRQLTQLASLGAPTGHAEKMSPSMMGQLDSWLIDHYRGCWHYFGLGAAQTYVPEVKVRMAQDGSLIGEPALLNPPTDPNLRSLADSAVRAVHTCNPMTIPERYKPYYDAWRARTIRFDPKDLS